MSSNLRNPNIFENHDLQVCIKVIEFKAEAKNCRLIFPEEVWLQIAEKLEDVDNFYRFFSASSYFNHLSKQLRVYYLFPQIAEIFYKQFKENTGVVRPVMKKCRLVCTIWKNSIESVLQNLPHWTNLDGPYHGSRVINNYYSSVHTFTSNRKILDFYHRFSKSHAITNSNPFVCRSIHFMWGFPQYEQEAEDDSPSTEQILLFLQTFGQHIWYFRLDVQTFERRNSENLPVLPSYSKLLEMLEFLPNLKSLFLFVWSGPLFEDSCQQLRLYIESNPFPHLKQLQSLQGMNIPAPISDAIFRANPHITTIFFHKGLCPDPTFPGNYRWEITENLPNLHQLFVVLRTVEQIRNLESVNFVWPLRNLCVKVTPGIPCHHIFQLISNKWATTLTELSLTFDYSENRVDWVPLELPNLQNFSITTANIIPLDFLLPTRNSLRHLCVRAFHVWRLMGLEDALEAEQTVRFAGFRDNFLESNIWAIFPKLSCVEYFHTIGIRSPPTIYRRFDWMLYQRSRE